MTPTNPFTLFGRWYESVAKAGIDKPHAMALATVDRHGQPSCRMVLLSSFDERGFVFHTNYQSRKGGDIAANPKAALTFWWDPLGFQVRIEGPVEETSAQESDAYFASRPRGSQLGAWASAQSRVIKGPAELNDAMAALTKKYEGQVVPRPPHWGGYRMVPEMFEFWINRADRLHDRLCYHLEPDKRWRVEHLAP